MKTNRIIFLLFLIIFFLSLASASYDYSYYKSTDYRDYESYGSGFYKTANHPVDYDKRYPTYDYRHGYTYRNTNEYREEDYKRAYYNKLYEYRYYDQYYSDYIHPSKWEDGQFYDYDKYHYNRHEPRRTIYLKDRYNHKDYFYEDDNWNKDYYYKDNDLKDRYDRVICYYYPPEGKLFYKRC